MSNDIVDGRELLCACSEMTLQQYYDFIAVNPKDFDEVLRETGAGQVCTACLLDLEHHYVRAFEERVRGATGNTVIAKKGPAATSMKRRIYNMIDGLMPLVPLKLRQVTPVVYGAGVKEWLCVSNDSLMYEGELAAPDFCLDIILRDGEGHLVEKRREIVATGDGLCLDLSEPFERADPSADGTLKLGWMDLMRRGVSPGIRGTTRPQFKIVAKAGVCAVHTQAATEQPKGGLSMRLRPDEDRHFLTVVNAENKQLSFRLSVSAAGLSKPIDMPIKVPPLGARLVEVPVPDVVQDDEAGILADVTWTTDGMNKVYVLSATPNLDRFSVDHA